MDNSRNSGYLSLSSTPLPHSSLDFPGFTVQIPGSTGRASPSTSIKILRHPTVLSHLIYPLPCKPCKPLGPQVKNLQCSSSGWLFVINTRPGNSPEILSALINSGATEIFISDRLTLLYQDIAKLLELQLFDGHPTPSGPITKSHSSTLTLDNGLQFPVDFLVTQFHESTPIVLGLPWLCDVNPDIDWATLTMKFDTRGAELAAAIHLLSLSTLDNTEPQDTQRTLEPRLSIPLPAPTPCPSNIPHNKYKGVAVGYR
ncbi:hypothetical protein C0992_006568 [Termitomyces sp. T32_za158]|nr:hypothetical protein C0992_006568 [Termitomyces sp. T32_za158]